MLPRKRLDISAGDLAHGYAATFGRHKPDALEDRVAAAFGEPEQAVVSLSVRTAFDALLQVLRWPPGTEVIVSGITIPHMPEILRAHGLTVVPVDVDPDTLSVDLNEIRRVVTPRTRAVLVAHLFGSRMDLQGVADFTKQHGLRLFEDAAQAFVGDGWTGHESADVSFFSFGTAKTATALGGSVTVIRDPLLRSSLRTQLACYKPRPRSTYRARVLRYAALAAASHPAVYGGLLRAIRLCGREPDQTIMALSRGFSGPNFFELIRRQPSSALLSVLARRLENVSAHHTNTRAATGRVFAELLATVPVVGRHAPSNSHWLFALSVPQPELLRDRLWQAGFDATCAASSLVAVADDRGWIPAMARQTMQGLVYVPVPAGMPLLRLHQYATVVHQAVREIHSSQPGLLPATSGAYSC